jgi:hypothetical protein
MTENPYVAPRAAIVVEAARTTGVRRKMVVALGWLGGAVMAFAAALGVASVASRSVGTAALAVATTVAAVGALMGIRASVAALRTSGASAGLIAGGLLGTAFSLGMMLLGGLATLLSTVTFQRGRQLRTAQGRVLLPPLGPGAAWAKAHVPIDVDDASRAALAEQWRENGRTEHASVAAFARLTLDLMALGAPPALVAAAQHDALDEIAHAEACFALARSIDGRSVGPAAFPEALRPRGWVRLRIRGFALATLAVDSLIDGALHEGVSARVVARLSRRCQDASIRTALRQIAADEGRHSAHGWDVVEWCLSEGGPAVARALEGALLALPPTMRTPLPAPAAAGAWERWGIHGHALEREEYEKAHRHLVERVRLLVVGAYEARKAA